MTKENLCKRCNGTGVEPPYRINRTTKHQGEGWACPKCHEKHYDVYANVCPECGLEFNSEEFNRIVRSL
jgi:hypothetical protein